MIGRLGDVAGSARETRGPRGFSSTRGKVKLSSCALPLAQSGKWHPAFSFAIERLLEKCDSQNKRAGHPDTENIQPF
jgi:hypothetical protein